mmetsp:Transcript_15499/g.24794  ORF Transcript_15499/g.24794 Transcript_15499/m.24794 type:complete len:329 (+) Transcript_15499:76-1062(+)
MSSRVSLQGEKPREEQTGSTQQDEVQDGLEEEDDDDDEQQEAGAKELTAKSNPRERPPLVATGQMSPFDVRFSQMRARHEFRDGRPLDQAIDLIEPLPWVETSDVREDRPVWYLKAPFPPIQVLQWRCKLRDETTGRPLVDEATGDELYDDEDRWFALDNRRLHCLQKVAVRFWPDKCVIDVAELPSGRQVTRFRELKKFRTLDRGRSVNIGGRMEGETLVRWSWREEVGLKEQDEAKDKGHVLRKRPRRWPLGSEKEGNFGSSQGSYRNDADEDEESSFSLRLQDMPWRGMLGFIALYLAMRSSMRVIAAFYTAWQKQSEGSEGLGG